MQRISSPAINSKETDSPQKLQGKTDRYAYVRNIFSLKACFQRVKSVFYFTHLFGKVLLIM